jgi:hypothetical protein
MKVTVIRSRIARASHGKPTAHRIASAQARWASRTLRAHPRPDNISLRGWERPTPRR